MLDVPILSYLLEKKKYKHSKYNEQTHNSFFKVYFDKGLSGEYAFEEYLAYFQGYKGILFNCYLPKADGTSSEIDIILLHESGVYVLEVKNYRGWIFGSENQRYWTQTLPDGYGGSVHNRFYNPIWQNNGHIKALRTFLADEDLPIYSGIVFSDYCTLKEINVTDGKYCIINGSDLLPALERNAEKVGKIISKDKIDALYRKLYPTTQVSEEEKLKHRLQVEKLKIK